MFLFEDPAYLLYTISIFSFIPLMIIGVIIQLNVTRTFNKYNSVRASSGISAEAYARNFLLDSGVSGIRFAAVRGSLTDNFNPKTNTISLSDTVRNSACVGAIGVACHEAGHAVQHAKNYFFSSLRLKLVPVVNIASTLIGPLYIIGYILGFGAMAGGTAIGNIFIIAGLVVMGLSMLFAFVTLPTEFNASRRAYAYLKTCMLPDEAAGVRKVLTAAALTYVASFLMSALQFIRLLALLLMSSNRRRR